MKNSTGIEHSQWDPTVQAGGCAATDVTYISAPQNIPELGVLDLENVNMDSCNRGTYSYCLEQTFKTLQKILFKLHINYIPQCRFSSDQIKSNTFYLSSSNELSSVAWWNKDVSQNASLQWSSLYRCETKVIIFKKYFVCVLIFLVIWTLYINGNLQK